MSKGKSHQLTEEQRNFVKSRLNGATKLREGLYRAISGAFRAQFRRTISRRVASELVEEQATLSQAIGPNFNASTRRRARNGPTIRRSRGRHPSLCQH
jgi:hypothetical protein